MSENYLKRLRRLLVLLPTVARAAQSGRGVRLAKAVELTGARDQEELLADLESVSGLWTDPALSEDAVDVYVEDGEVHITYVRSFGAPPAFSLAEGAVLLAALLPFQDEAPRPVKEAIRKLRKAIPAELRPEAQRLAQGLDVLTEPPGPWAGVLREAIEKRVETALEYRAVADGAIARRLVEPRLLLHREGNWYLAAWSIEKEEEHLYRLDRIATVELGTRIFGEHKGPPLARYARRSLFFESGAEREVVLRYTGTAARIAQERWGVRAKPEAEGSVTAAVKVTPGNYLFGTILGHGGEACVEGPADVVESFRERTRELTQLYRD